MVEPSKVYITLLAKSEGFAEPAKNWHFRRDCEESWSRERLKRKNLLLELLTPQMGLFWLSCESMPLSLLQLLDSILTAALAIIDHIRSDNPQCQNEVP